jgi:hypothetical protein
MKRIRPIQLIAASLTVLLFLSLAITSPVPTARSAARSSGPQLSKSLPPKFTNKYRMEFVLIPEGKFSMIGRRWTPKSQPTA